MENNKQSKWHEIRNDYIDETNRHKGILEMAIDAWKTNDPKEDGEVIAKVIAFKHNENDRENTVHLVHIDNDATIDSYARNIITEGVNTMKHIKF